MPNGELLLAFVDAVLARDETRLVDLRRAIREAMGDAAFVDICATIASFNAVVKIADGTGIPLEADKAERTEALRSELQINRLQKRDG